MAKLLDDGEFLKCLHSLIRLGVGNQVKLKDVLFTCRENDSKVDQVYAAVSKGLRCKTSKGRLRCLALVEEMFRRSSKFRKLFCDHLQDHLRLLAEVDPMGSRLPPLKSDAKLLQTKFLQLLDSWCKQFGNEYKTLQLTVDHIKLVLKIDSLQPILQTGDSADESRRTLLTQRGKSFLNDVREEMGNCLREMNSCFALLVPNLTDSTTSSSSDTPAPIDLSAHGVPVGMSGRTAISIQVEVNFNPVIKPSTNNQVIRETLLDCDALVRKRFLPPLEKHIRLLTNVDGSEALLTELTRWRSQLLTAQTKLTELKLSAAPPIGNDTDSSDNEFEDVDIQSTSCFHSAH